MEHSASNAENFALIKSQRKKIEETTLTYDYGYEALWKWAYIATVATEEETQFDTVKKELVYSRCRESLL